MYNRFIQEVRFRDGPLFGIKDEVLKVNAYLDSRGQTTKNQVRNLEVILETDLSFSSHVKAVTKSAYYHLKNIARIRCFVSSQDLEKLVHAFITKSSQVTFIYIAPLTIQIVTKHCTISK